MFGQPDSLADVFPLAVGNQWEYAYRTSSADYISGTSYSDTGSARFFVRNRQSFADSTIWQIFQSRNIVHWVRDFIGHITTYQIEDSTLIYLVELHAGQHQLYSALEAYSIRNSVFPFGLDLTDSTKVFRLRRVDSLGIATFRTFRRPSPPFSFPNLYFVFSFKANVGLLSVNARDTMITGGRFASNHALRSSIIVSVNSKNSELPERLHLEQNYPNPFNPTTTIRYTLPKTSRVSLKVFDVMGREVATLVDGVEEAGYKSVQFDANGMASGVYFYQLRAGGFVETKKLMIIR